MYLIVNQQGKVLYGRTDLPTVDGEIAITQLYLGEIPDDKELYFNFETEEFYLQ